MKIKDGKQEWFDEFYKNDKSSLYAGDITDYAGAWATLMEKEIDEGNNLSDIAYNTSLTADTKGITGHMFQQAVKLLVNCWIYGDELHKWYKKYYN